MRREVGCWWRTLGIIPLACKIVRRSVTYFCAEGAYGVGIDTEGVHRSGGWTGGRWRAHVWWWGAFGRVIEDYPSSSVVWGSTVWDEGALLLRSWIEVVKTQFHALWVTKCAYYAFTGDGTSAVPWWFSPAKFDEDGGGNIRFFYFDSTVMSYPFLNAVRFAGTYNDFEAFHNDDISYYFEAWLDHMSKRRW